MKGIRSLLTGDRPLVMGVLNVTPDSFYDGGEYTHMEAVKSRVLQMVAEGVDIIDVGGESSRPGAPPVSVMTERDRISVVYDLIKQVDVPFSIDTYKVSTARDALEHGFSVINDITGGGENGDMFDLAAEFDAPIVIMHMQGNPETMQQNPYYDDVIKSLKEFFSARVALAKSRGIGEHQIILDPGIGFGKRIQDNDEILRKLNSLNDLGYPILFGASRKSFLAIDVDSPEDRLAASLSALTVAVQNGAKIVRVHDVKESVKCVKFMQRLLIN